MALLESASGDVFIGVDLASEAGVGGCAERIALWDARLAGAKRFRSIVVATRATGEMAPDPPCGACLQVLFEFAPTLTVHWRGTPQGVPVRDLLPNAFGPRSLRSAKQ